jgi:hypothetical protein
MAINNQQLYQREAAWPPLEGTMDSHRNTFLKKKRKRKQTQN